MDKLVESKFFQKLTAIGQKFSNSKTFSAISGGLMTGTGITLVGTVFMIVANLLTYSGLIETDGVVYSLLVKPYNMTCGMMSLVIVFGIAYVSAKLNRLKSPVSAGISSLLIFILVAAPAQTVTLADGSTMTVLDTTCLGGGGIFTAIIVALVTVKIITFCTEKNIVVKLPDVVPESLSSSFTAMIPMFFSLLIFYSISEVLERVFGTTLPLLIMYLLSIPLGALNSAPGIVIAGIVACLLWFTGIHGSMVVCISLLPFYMEAVLANAQLVTQGLEPVFSPILLLFHHATVGGTGCTLGLVLLGLKSRSKQIKAICKASVIPSFFNINEPVVFGMPIIYNPILGIPYILCPVVYVLLNYAGYALGFLKAPYILMLATTPVGVADFLQTLSWTNAVFPYLFIPVSMLLYYPFYKAYEKQLMKKEQESAEA